MEWSLKASAVVDHEDVEVDPDVPVAPRAGEPPTRRRFRAPFILAAVAATAVVLIAAVLLSSPGLDMGQKQSASEWLFVGCPLAALVCCLHSARLSTGKARSTWAFFAATCAMWTLGNALRFHADGVAAAQQFPVNDLVHLLALPLAVAGLLSCPADTRARPQDRLRVLSGVLLIVSSVLFVSYQLALGEVFDRLGPGLGSDVVRIHLLGDVLLVSLAIVMTGGNWQAWRARLLILAIGLVAYGVGSQVYALLGARGLYSSGTPWDLAWIAAYLLVGLGALAPVSRPRGDRASQGVSITLHGAALLHLCMAFAIAVAVYRGIDSWVEVALGAPVLVFFGLRQTALAAESRALRLDLEAKVADRVTELSRLVERHQRILEAVGEGIYGVDSRGVISFVNPAAEQQLGRASADLVGREAHAAFHATTAESRTGGCHLRPVLVEGTLSRRSDVSYLRRDGTAFPVEVTAAPKHDAAGLRGSVVIFSDISERRALERMKEEFVSVVSHELRTPLTAMRGSLGLLAGGALGALPASAERMVRIALDSSERLTRLINDLLDMERLESGTLPMTFVPVSCESLVATTVVQLQHIAEAAGVELVAGPTPGRVIVEPDRVVQALTNLVGNAVKFSPSGSAVTVSAEPQGAFVHFRVADTGRGIPAEMLDSVFARFQQVDSSDSREKGGTGLGLAITKTIVERHGGRIWVESTVGRGSVFQFTLPAVLDRDREPILRSAPGSPAVNRTVLLCDDDPARLEALGRTLGRLGYDTTPVTRGGDVFATATAARPDVILLDILMHEGWEMVRQLKAQPETRDIPIVIMSGPGPELDASLTGGTAGWLAQPVGQEQVGEVLADVLHLEPPVPAVLVLVVEDDEDLAAVLVTMFERRGLRACSSATQREAVALSRMLQPDVLVLDLGLPEGNGFGVVDELRRDDRLRTVPVVIYSARELDTSSRDRLRLGETAFLTKTRSTPDELADRVLQVVGGTGAAAAAEPAAPGGSS